MRRWVGKLSPKIMVTLAICTNRGIKPKTAQCLLELATYSQDLHILVAERGFTIAENRNYCVVQAQKNGSSHILFIDDDMTFPKDTLERLLACNKEVVGVKSYSRCFPLAPTTGLQNEKGEYKDPSKHASFEMKMPEELFEAHFIGMGVGLIDMKVFEKIKKPYFMFTYDGNGQVKDGEDGTFCQKVKKAGMKVWCDPTIPIGHLGEAEFGEELNNKLAGIYNVNSI